jgi:hypothetical protein
MQISPTKGKRKYEKESVQETVEGSIDPVSLIRATVSSTFNQGRFEQEVFVEVVQGVSLRSEDFACL